MGNIKSFCCKDSESETDDHDERSRILNDQSGAEHQRSSWDELYGSSASVASRPDTPSYGSINAGSSNKLEQTALNKIIQKMASNVIDVAPGETVVLQQVEINDRQKTYQSKLNQLKSQLALKSTRVPRWSNSNAGTANTTIVTNNAHNISSFDNNLLNASAINTTSGSTTIIASPNTTFGHHSLLNQSSNSTLFNSTSNSSGVNNRSIDSRRADCEPIGNSELQLINRISQRSTHAVRDGLVVKSTDQVVVPMSNLI